MPFEKESINAGKPEFTFCLISYFISQPKACLEQNDFASFFKKK